MRKSCIWCLPKLRAVGQLRILRSSLRVRGGSSTFCSLPAAWSFCSCVRWRIPWFPSCLVSVLVDFSRPQFSFPARAFPSRGRCAPQFSFCRSMLLLRAVMLATDGFLPVSVADAWAGHLVHLQGCAGSRSAPPCALIFQLPALANGFSCSWICHPRFVFSPVIFGRCFCAERQRSSNLFLCCDLWVAFPCQLALSLSCSVLGSLLSDLSVRSWWFLVRLRR
jgi:hypothetical protein